MLREGGVIGSLLAEGRSSGTLVPLREVADLRGGVVTRANAFFIVRELPFDQIPRRFHITRQDYERVTVVMDGLETPFRVERKYLRPIVKGPEALVTPTTIEGTDQRLFVCERSRAEMEEDRDTGALAYLRRGETVAYNVSSDTLKGGIPAQRSNIRNRKPYWYSLNVPPSAPQRIVVPEHVDVRYPVSLLGPDEDDHVVIDKLYVARLYRPDDGHVLLAGLSSLLTWFQLELRGRTQLGQGVLELKKPDWGGVLVLNPAFLDDAHRATLLDAFAPLSSRQETNGVAALTDADREAFDERYLSMMGLGDPAEFRMLLAEELRAAVQERHLRRQSVAEARASQRRVQRSSSSVDGYAARIVAAMDPHPDPRHLVPAGARMTTVPITGSVEGPLSVGDDLFTYGQVFAGTERVANTIDDESARFVMAVLRHDPELTAVDVPAKAAVVMELLEVESQAWIRRFDRAAQPILQGIAETRLREAVRRRALQLLHAQ
ncbi:hypothetical protein [Actinomadura luteofluorescens]|uniref:hypothetical protein n=1 Tax=Actinomadura luteofluorescens TaxID=46163 RepID=UPI0030D3E10F